MYQLYLKEAAREREADGQNNREPGKNVEEKDQWREAWGQREAETRGEASPHPALHVLCSGLACLARDPPGLSSLERNSPGRNIQGPVQLGPKGFFPEAAAGWLPGTRAFRVEGTHSLKLAQS